MYSDTTVPLGTYIGNGTGEDDAEVHYTLKLNEKRIFWLDYRSVTPLKTESWHSDGTFAFIKDKDTPIVSCEIGGLPGQARVGQLYNFVIKAGVEGAKVLERQGVHLQPQPDTQDGDDRPKCTACGQEIEGQVLKVGGESYHPNCFVCDGCKKPLSGSFSRQSDGRKLCTDCVPRNYCDICKRLINGAAVKVGNATYHPDCFVCDSCGGRLKGQFMTVKKGDETLRFCNKECKDSPERITRPKPEETAADAAVEAEKEKAAPPAAPAAAAKAPTPAPAPSKRTVPLGCYIGNGKIDEGTSVKYTIRLMDDDQCWLDCTKETKIASGTWHAEGTYCEVDGQIKFTVESHPHGGGPEMGRVYNFAIEKVDSEKETTTRLTCEGVVCSVQMSMREYDDLKDEKRCAAAPKAKAEAPTGPAPAIPGEGVPTKVMAGSTGVMERKQVDTMGYSAVKVSPDAKPAAPAVATQPPPAPAAAAAAAAAPVAAEAAPVATATPGGDCVLTLEELKNGDVWKARGVDPSRREEYLADDVFADLFKMSKADFAKLPKWKRDQAKKPLGLY
eukprot:TRINITY_DN3115_c0_g1_i1.p1 TRINITY_DN3115_c0_g1~~TRINITY_DN3115_c0_g1_i1.p1  ORF type:complete len:559 (+),score=147.34 TRINITY_DN3115_c0_g1_i1:64-1740(+)